MAGKLRSFRNKKAFELVPLSPEGRQSIYGLRDVELCDSTDPVQFDGYMVKTTGLKTLVSIKMEYMNANKERLYDTVNFLTSLYPYRNYKNMESLERAADYIHSAYEEVSLPVSRQEWEVKGNVYGNILASYQPHKRRRFILGAHYDVYKDQPGANDNASSVAGLLEVARLLAANIPSLEYGIDFVAYCLEEPPFFNTKNMGSYIHAKSVYERQQDILGMISLEMIGFGRKIGEEPAGTGKANEKYLVVSGIRKHYDFNKTIAQLLRGAGNLQAKTIMYADAYRNNAPSDHRNYLKFGFPAVMVIGTYGDGNPHYHKKSDTIHTLDFALMAEATNNIAYAITHL